MRPAIGFIGAAGTLDDRRPSNGLIPAARREHRVEARVPRTAAQLCICSVLAAPETLINFVQVSENAARWLT